MSFLWKMNVRLACGRDSLKNSPKIIFKQLSIISWTNLNKIHCKITLHIMKERWHFFPHQKIARLSNFDRLPDGTRESPWCSPRFFTVHIGGSPKRFELGTVFGWASSGTRELLPLPKYLDSFSGDKYLITLWKKRTRKKNSQKNLKVQEQSALYCYVTWRETQAKVPYFSPSYAATYTLSSWS